MASVADEQVGSVLLVLSGSVIRRIDEIVLSKRVSYVGRGKFKLTALQQDEAKRILKTSGSKSAQQYIDKLQRQHQEAQRTSARRPSRTSVITEILLQNLDAYAANVSR
jgi:hypothetical protein